MHKDSNSPFPCQYLLFSVYLGVWLFCFVLIFFKLINLFIYGCAWSSFLCEGFLWSRQAGATLHRGARASHYRGLSCCGAQAPDAQAQQLWLTGLVAQRHVGSSQTRARTRVPCIGRQILNHCATREAPLFCFDSCYPNGCEVVSHCGFDLHFPEWIVMLSIFSWAYWPFLYFLWRNVYSSLFFFPQPCLTACQDLSSWTRDWTRAPSSGSMES